MIQYNDSQSIFIQIANRICDHILSGRYRECERVPSVREMGVEMGVNPHTVMRSYERLMMNNILYNKRGIGLFVTEGAEREIRRMRRKQFMEETLPQLFREMELIGINKEDVEQVYEAYTKLRE